MEKQNKKRGTSAEQKRRILPKSEVPMPPARGYRIELTGGGDTVRALVSGARRILVCSSEVVVLETKDGRLTFDGVGLDCLCYEGGVAEILGRIRALSLGCEGER